MIRAFLLMTPPSAVLAATISMANAASVPVGQIPNGVGNALTLIHGDHRSCRRDRYGWHRHNRWGERRRCRRWDGRGRRPDACVRFGPFWYCDF
jgi:hypothetical protein